MPGASREIRRFDLGKPIDTASHTNERMERINFIG